MHAEPEWVPHLARHQVPTSCSNMQERLVREAEPGIEKAGRCLYALSRWQRFSAYCLSSAKQVLRCSNVVQQTVSRVHVSVESIQILLLRKPANQKRSRQVRRAFQPDGIGIRIGRIRV